MNNLIINPKVASKIRAIITYFLLINESFIADQLLAFPVKLNQEYKNYGKQRT